MFDGVGETGQSQRLTVKVKTFFRHKVTVIDAQVLESRHVAQAGRGCRRKVNVVGSEPLQASGALKVSE